MRKYEDLKIAVAGTGYVGLSIAMLLSQHHKVMAVDIVPEKVKLINDRKSPVQDDYIEKYLSEKDLDLTATLDAVDGYSDADFVIIATPTNYNSKKNFFDTSAVETVIDLVMKYAPEAIIVIKSTIPVGYTESIREKTGSNNIIFSPEFLRESKALYDNVYPKFSVDFSWAMMTGKIIRSCRKTRLSGTGLGIVISTFSNEMERTFSWIMECMRAF